MTTVIDRPVATVATFVDVTPEMAADMLRRNPVNRKLKPKSVDAYARDMAAGNWRQTCEPIKFTAGLLLLDGQHRLHAIVASGVTVRLLVAEGVEEAAQEVMDTGVKRSAADALGLYGESKNQSLVAAIARLAINVEVGGFGSFAVTRQVTNAEILSFVQANPDVRLAADRAGTVARQIDASSTAAVGYALWRMRRVDPYALESFISAAVDRVGLYPGDPATAMTRRLAEARRNRERLSVAAQVSVMFRAWNARREGRPLQKIPVTTNGSSVAVPTLR